MRYLVRSGWKRENSVVASWEEEEMKVDCEGLKRKRTVHLQAVPAGVGLK